jgi:hypothetical protein
MAASATPLRIFEVVVALAPAPHATAPLATIIDDALRPPIS